MKSNQLVPSEIIEQRIFVLRGKKVLFDVHLAELYGIPTKRLNEQVRRNLRRFPDDFMFQLSQEEYDAVRSHFATLEKGRGRFRKYRPYDGHHLPQTEFVVGDCSHVQRCGYQIVPGTRLRSFSVAPKLL